MSFNKWPKRSAEKNYFMVPNEIFSIGLDFREISLYSYLLRCENRKTYQCYPSYKTIGHAIGMSENTVAKYVRQLEEKGLIYTEPTMVRSKDGRPLNGNLLYTVRPIQGVLEAFYERQLRQVEEDVARYHAAKLLEKSNAQSRQNTPCAPFQEEPSPSRPQGLKDEFEPLSEEFAGSGVTTDFSPFWAEMRDVELVTTQSRIKAWRRTCRRSRHFCPQCGQFRELEAGAFARRNKHRWRQLPRKAPCCRAFQGCLTAKRRN